MSRGHRWTCAGCALLLAFGGACGDHDSPEQAEPGRTVTASPGDSALFPGAEEPGPQFDND